MSSTYIDWFLEFPLAAALWAFHGPYHDSDFLSLHKITLVESIYCKATIYIFTGRGVKPQSLTHRYQHR